MTRKFSVAFDYRCPFAYNAHAAIVAALREGVEIDVTFIPFSLDQNHVEEGEVDIWDRPATERGTGAMALLFGIAVRDNFPDQFLDFHMEAFAARHVHSLAIRDEAVMRNVCTLVGLDPDRVAELALGDATLATLKTEHTALVADYEYSGSQHSSLPEPLPSSGSWIAEMSPIFSRPWTSSSGATSTS